MNAARPIVLLALATTVPLAAQAPSVLDLQRDYHLGAYSGAVEVGTGQLRLFAAFGEVSLTTTGVLTGTLDVYETDTGGTVITLADPVAATYVVRPDGLLVLDVDPMAPGTDLRGFWIDAGGEVFHGSRSRSEEEADSFLAIAHATGLTTASLNGTYAFAGQRLEFAGTTWQTVGQRGAIVFDGTGNATVSGDEVHQSTTGSSSSTFAGTIGYTVAADGAITIDGQPGAMTQDGELLFVLTQQATGEVGMSIAVRVGSGLTVGDVAGRYGFSTQGYWLGTMPWQPLTSTSVGELEIVATGPGSGTWTRDGALVEGGPTSLGVSPWAGTGTLSLAPDGAMALADSLFVRELTVSANGRFVVGRTAGSRTDLWIGSRQCPEAFAYGNDTPGAGGFAPRLGMKGFPTLGNAGWSYVVDLGLGGGIGLLPISTGFAGPLQVFGGEIWIDPLQVGYMPLVLLGGVPGAAGQGSALVPLPIPTTITLVGGSLFAQALVLDPGAPAGWSMSQGFSATICR